MNILIESFQRGFVMVMAVVILMGSILAIALWLISMNELFFSDEKGSWKEYGIATVIGIAATTILMTIIGFVVFI